MGGWIAVETCTFATMGRRRRGAREREERGQPEPWGPSARPSARPRHGEQALIGSCRATRVSAVWTACACIGESERTAGMEMGAKSNPTLNSSPWEPRSDDRPTAANQIGGPPTVSRTHARLRKDVAFIRKIRVQTPEFPAQTSITDECSSAGRKGSSHSCSRWSGQLFGRCRKTRRTGMEADALPRRHAVTHWHRAKPFNGVGVDPVPCALAGSRQGQYWRHARSARHELTSVRKTTAVRRMRRLCSFAWKQSPSFSIHCCPLLSASVRCCS